MPIYEFKCEDCKKVFEILKWDRETTQITCDCGGRAFRIISAGSFRGEKNWRLPK